MARLSPKPVSSKRPTRPWDADREPAAKAPEDEVSEIDIWIGTRIRLRRLELHLKGTTLAAMCRVSPFTVERWELGSIRVVPARLWDLALNLEVNPGWFFEGFQPDNPQRIETASQIGDLMGEVSLDIVIAMQSLTSANRQVARTVVNALLATQPNETGHRIVEVEDQAA